MHFSLCSLDSFQFPAHLFQFLLVDKFRFPFNNANTFQFKVFLNFTCTFPNSSLGISDVISTQFDGKSYHSLNQQTQHPFRPSVSYPLLIKTVISQRSLSQAVFGLW